MDKDLASAFELAREEIASGRHWYICTALKDLYYAKKILGLDYDLAREIVMGRLRAGGAANVSSWLQRNVPGFVDAYYSGRVQDSDIQEYRVRWLDALIEEFS